MQAWIGVGQAQRLRASWHLECVICSLSSTLSLSDLIRSVWLSQEVKIIIPILEMRKSRLREVK